MHLKLRVILLHILYSFIYCGDVIKENDRNLVIYYDPLICDGEQFVFPNKSPCSSDSHVKLSAFSNLEIYINVSYSFPEPGELKIRWNRMDYTFSNTCCIAKVKNGAWSSKYWRDYRYVHTNYTLEYEFSNNKTVCYRKLAFQIPPLQAMPVVAKKLPTKLWLFSYIDVTDSSAVMLRIQKSPASFNIKNYTVEAFTNENLLKTITIANDNNDTELSVNFNNMLEHASSYYFTIRPVDTVITTISRTPIISNPYIDEAGFILRSCIVLIWIVMAASIYCLILRVRSYRASRAYKKCGRMQVLLVYPSHNSFHNDAVNGIYMFLKNYFDINVKLDTQDECRDPPQWYRDTFDQSDHLVVVPFTEHKSTINIDKNNVIQSAYTIPLNLLKNNMSKRVSVIMLPYCYENDVPPEVKTCRRFKLPEECINWIKSMVGGVTVTKEQRYGIKKLRTVIEDATGNIKTAIGSDLVALDVKYEGLMERTEVDADTWKNDALDEALQNLLNTKLNVRETAQKQSGFIVSAQLDSDYSDQSDEEIDTQPFNGFNVRDIPDL